MLPDVGSRIVWPGADRAPRLGVLDQRAGHAVLDRAGGVVALELGVDAHARLRRQPLQLDQRRVADRGDDVRVLPPAGAVLEPGLEHFRKCSGWAARRRGSRRRERGRGRLSGRLRGKAVKRPADSAIARLRRAADAAWRRRGQLRSRPAWRHAVIDTGCGPAAGSVHRGVYAVGRQPLDRRGRWLAAVLACGPDAALSHRDAGDAAGSLTGRARRSPVHRVTLARDERRAGSQPAAVIA